MRLSSLYKTIAVFAVALSGTISQAGGCNIEWVSPAKELASNYLANLVHDKLEEIEKAMNAKGQTLNAVFVARRGEKMDGFQVYKNDPAVQLQDYLTELTKAIKTLENSNDRSYGTGAATLPEQLFVKNDLKYSHMGILLKRNPAVPKDQQPEADWVYVTHLLSECDEKSNRYGASDLFFKTFDTFFWDTKILKKKAYANSALLFVPTPEVQARIRELFDHREIYRAGLHQPKYNVAAVPFRLKGPSNPKGKVPTDFYQLKDQNSNQWPLELLAAATKQVGQIQNRKEAQDQLMATNYRPSILRPVGLKESMACSLRKGPLHLWDASNLLSCEDQAFRSAGIVQLITVSSVVDYMIRNGLMAESIDRPNTPGIYEISASAEVIGNLVKDEKILENIFKDPKKMKDQKTTTSDEINE